MNTASTAQLSAEEWHGCPLNIGDVLEVHSFCGCGNPWYKVRSEYRPWFYCLHRSDCTSTPSTGE
jgi:hypothetical protein